MADTQSRTLIPLLILKLLEEYSDEKHPLTREDIERLLDEKYRVTMERKAFFRHIEHLNELEDVDIRRVSVKPRDPEKKACAGFFLADRVLSDSELRLIIDSLSGNCFLSDTETRELIDRVAGLSSRYFKKKISHYRFFNDRGKTANSTLLYHLEIIDDAIAEKKKITFHRLRITGNGKSEVNPALCGPATPVQTIVKGRSYYLLFLIRNKLRICPLSKMVDVEITEEPAVDLRELYPNGFDYNSLLKEDPDLLVIHSQYRPRFCTFHCYPDMLDDLKDHFGSDLRVCPVEHNRNGTAEGMLEVSVITNTYAAMEFAWAHMDTVWLVAPDHTNRVLRKRLRAAEQYYQYLEEAFDAGRKKDPGLQ